MKMELKCLKFKYKYESGQILITEIDGTELDTPFKPLSRLELIVKKYDYNLLRKSEWTNDRINDPDYGVANEFSRGNYVINSLTGNFHYLGYQIFSDDIMMNFVKPIDLNEDLLKKIGFMEIDKGFFRFKDTDFTLDYTEDLGYVTEQGTPINHLHRLQNYFKFLSNFDIVLKYPFGYFNILLKDL